MNRSPAFQFYPDKWQSHTRRLSDQSYRVFHELICWMWQHSPDHCSITSSHDAVACAVAMPVECVRIAFADIMNEFSPLLRCENGRWVCNGLRKEAEKQNNRRNSAKANANARWNNATASNQQCGNDAVALNPQCFPSPSPSPSLVPVVQRFKKPSIEEVRLQASKIGLSEDEAGKFFNYYESNGWKVGRNPMKSWTHALVNWKNNVKSYGNNQVNQKPNPRNAGVVGDLAEISRKTAEVVARRQEERERRNELL